MSSFQTQRNPFLMIATMASTLPCCWLVSAFYCHTIVSSLMWTTSTANSKVWCNQPVAHHRIDQIKFTELWMEKVTTMHCTVILQVMLVNSSLFHCQAPLLCSTWVWRIYLWLSVPSLWTTHSWRDWAYTLASVWVRTCKSRPLKYNNERLLHIFYMHVTLLLFIDCNITQFLVLHI